MSSKKRITCEELAEALTVLTGTMLANDVEPFEKYIKEAKEENIIEENVDAHRSRLLEEFVIMFVFATTIACGKGISDEHIRARVLDRYHYLTFGTAIEAGIIKQSVAELVKRYRQNYKVYYQALENEAEPGPLFHMGKAFLTRALGKRFSLNISLNLKVSFLFVATLRAVSELIQNYEIIDDI